MTKAFAPFSALAIMIATTAMSNVQAAVVETPVAPVRIVWMSDTTGTSIQNAETLLQPFAGQVSVADSGNSSKLTTQPGKKASILLDFGRELYGGLKLYSGMPNNKKSRHLRVCLGESVTEAMSDVDDPNQVEANPTNDHSCRDFVVEMPWLGSVECGKSGFRFARIDALDEREPVELRYVEARSLMIDDPEIGSFECSDPRLTDIWNVGAYTVKLNMQDYIWDGIKRDRLVWLGDMHPEVMTIATVWGEMPVVHKTLDFAVSDTPIPGWMNNMCSYSIWWLIIQRDYYLYTGNIDHLRSNQKYINDLANQIASKVDKKGKEHLDGTRFLDWPTSEKPEIIAAGMQALTHMSMVAAADIAKYLDDKELAATAAETLKRMGNQKIKPTDCKQTAALSLLAGMSGDTAKDLATIEADGSHGFSTFYGYYMIDALARNGKIDKALKLISDYWGSMIDLGATTFWEDLNYADTKNAAPITEFVPEGKYDIHSGGGAYCYKGLRLSLCHGWASGPTPWLTRHVLGVSPIEPGCATLEINPNLGSLEWAKGTFPTPKGEVQIDVTRDATGKAVCNVRAPKGINIINRAEGAVLTYSK